MKMSYRRTPDPHQECEMHIPDGPFEAKVSLTGSVSWLKIEDRHGDEFVLYVRHPEQLRDVSNAINEALKVEVAR